MHITLRRLDGLPSFRQQRVGKLLLALLREKNDERFQIVHFSIQTNHLHLIVEADNRDVVRRKMSGVTIAFAKRFNRLLGRRKGKVWDDRYHRRDIKSTRDMRNVLRYVFGNAKKHGLIPARAAILDGYSTAWLFAEWDRPLPRVVGGEHWPRPRPRTELLLYSCGVEGELIVTEAPRSS